MPNTYTAEDFVATAGLATCAEMEVDALYWQGRRAKIVEDLGDTVKLDLFDVNGNYEYTVTVPEADLYAQAT